jgi:hypothetical protein
VTPDGLADLLSSGFDLSVSTCSTIIWFQTFSSVSHLIWKTKVKPTLEPVR